MHNEFDGTCPICGNTLIRKESESAYYCTNKNCDAKHIEGLIHYASRDAMNIEGFGDNITEDFYNMGYLKRVYDYYTLDKYKEELMSLEGFGEKRNIKLLSNIEKSKEKIIVVAHRGAAGGNIPCNTMAAYEIALKQGADMIEADVSCSRDGILFLFHPGMEREHLGKRKNLKNKKL